MTVTALHAVPIAVGAAAVFPYKPGWMEVGKRQAKYPDENGSLDFNLFRLSGPGPINPKATRIWAPRRMTGSIEPPTHDLRTQGLDVSFTSHFKPKNSEQARCINECVALLAQGENFIFQAPTGFGKTYCCCEIIAQVGKKAIIIVNKEDTRDQWLEAITVVLGLKREKGGVGFIQGDICEVYDRKICIAMIQSLSKENKFAAGTFQEFGLPIWDEVHRVGADYFSNSCFMIPATLRLGVSANPKRKDGRDEVIEAHIGPVLVETKLMPMKFSVIVEESPWYCPTTIKKDKEGRIVMDEATGQAARTPIPHSAGACGHITRMLTHHHERNRKITTFVLQAVKKFGRKVLVQSDTKEHLETLASMIAHAGIPTPQITFYVGGLTKAQRERAKLGSVIMATYSQTREATDIPALDTLVMATPISDPEQAIGRVIRFLPDKNEPLIYDLRDYTSPIFTGYAKSRDKFYASKGAKVKKVAVKAMAIDKHVKPVTIQDSKKQPAILKE